MNEKQTKTQGHVVDKLGRKIRAAKRKLASEMLQAFEEETNESADARMEFGELADRLVRLRQDVEKKGGKYLGSYVSVSALEEEQEPRNPDAMYCVHLESYYAKDDKCHRLAEHIDRIAVRDIPEDVQTELQKKGKAKLKVDI
jgi:hypothetical protein